MGANGAGKSTLLAIVSGRIRPWAGKVEVREVVGVPQNPDLSLLCGSVEEELSFAPQQAGLSGKALQERVEWALSALSLSALRHRPPQALSRGQRLRTAVAAALTARPALLLLDEPTAGQDPEQVERMFCGIPLEVSLLFACHDPRRFYVIPPV